MKKNPGLELSTILDRCLDDLAEGRSVSSCLDRFPEHAAQLRPLLEVALLVRRAPPPVARREAVERGRIRMLAALSDRPRSAAVGRRFGAVVVPVSRGRWRAWTLGLPAPRVIATVVTVVAVLLTTLMVKTPLSLLPAQVVPAAAMLAEVHGAVEVCADPCVAWLPAASGRVLHAGESVRTLEGGTARLTYGDGSTTEMLPVTEIVLVELPQGARGPVLYQARGEARHRVLEQAAGQGPKANFEVRSPTFAIVAAEGAFGLVIGADGDTAVWVSSGRAVAHLGATVRTLAAGETWFAPGGGPPERSEDGPQAPGRELAGTRVPAETPLPEPSDPRDDEKQPPGQQGRPETPPGQQDKLDIPPGQQGRPETPPGQQDKPETPPGQQDKPDIPPGQQDKPETPPGQQDKPETPPGQQGKPETPPGQQGKDKGR